MSMSFKTISQVAQEIGLMPHVLRFWEQELPFIKPLKRNGRRLYSPDDIALLKNVKVLLYEKGYTIKGVKKELKIQQKENQYKKCLEESLLCLEQIYDNIVKKYNL